MDRPAGTINACDALAIEVNVLFVDVAAEVGFGEHFTAWARRPVHGAGRLLHAYLIGIIRIRYARIRYHFVFCVVGGRVAETVIDHVSGSVIADTTELVLDTGRHIQSLSTATFKARY